MKEENNCCILEFLRNLSKNNERTWFQAHYGEYLQAKGRVEDLTEGLIAALSNFDDSVKDIRAKDCLFRIYRDIRFSLDKTPYKTHFGTYISKGGRKGLHCGYYFQFEPGASFLAGGAYGLTPGQMRELRLSILDGMDEFSAIVDDAAFLRAFSWWNSNPLGRLPAYLPKDAPRRDILLQRDIVFRHQISDSLLLDSSAVEALSEKCLTLKPFLDFLNYTIDDF